MPLRKLVKRTEKWDPPAASAKGKLIAVARSRVLLLVRELVEAKGPSRRTSAVRLRLGGAEDRTQPVRNDGPLLWDEAFILPIVPGPLTLRVSVEDGATSRVWASGVIDIPADALSLYETLPESIPLFNDGCKMGRLLVEFERPPLFTGLPSGTIHPDPRPPLHVTVVDVHEFRAPRTAHNLLAVRIRLGGTHGQTAPKPRAPRLHFGEGFELTDEGASGTQILHLQLANDNADVLATGTLQIDTESPVPVSCSVPVYDKAVQVARVSLVVEPWIPGARAAPLPDPHDFDEHDDLDRGSQLSGSHASDPPFEPLENGGAVDSTTLNLTVVSASGLPAEWAAEGVMVGLALDQSEPICTASVVGSTEPVFAEGLEFATDAPAPPAALEVFLFPTGRPEEPLAYGCLPLLTLRPGALRRERVLLTAEGEPAGSVVLELLLRHHREVITRGVGGGARQGHAPRAPASIPSSRGSIADDLVADLAEYTRRPPSHRNPLGSDRSSQPEEPLLRQPRPHPFHTQAPQQPTTTLLRPSPQKSDAPTPRVPVGSSPEAEGAEADGLLVLVRGLTRNPQLGDIGPTHVEVALLSEAAVTADSRGYQWDELVALTLPPELPDALAVLHLRLIATRTGDTLATGAVSLPDAFDPGTGQGQALVAMHFGDVKVGDLQLAMSLTDVSSALHAAAEASTVGVPPNQAGHGHRPGGHGCHWQEAQHREESLRMLKDQVAELQDKAATRQRAARAGDPRMSPTASAEGTSEEGPRGMRPMPMRTHCGRSDPSGNDSRLLDRLAEAEATAAASAVFAAERLEACVVLEDQIRRLKGDHSPPMFPGLESRSPPQSPSLTKALAAVPTAEALMLPTHVRLELEAQEREIRALAKYNRTLEARLAQTPGASVASPGSAHSALTDATQARLEALNEELAEARALLAVDGVCGQLSVTATAVECPSASLRPVAVLRLGVAEAQLSLADSTSGAEARFLLPAAPESLGDLRVVVYDEAQGILIGRTTIPLDFPQLSVGPWHGWVPVPPASRLQLRLAYTPAVPRSLLPLPSSRSAATSRPHGSTQTAFSSSQDPLVATILEARDLEATGREAVVRLRLGAAVAETTPRRDQEWREVFVLDDPAAVLRLEAHALTASGSHLLGRASINARAGTAGAAGQWLPLTLEGRPAGEVRLRYHSGATVAALSERLAVLDAA